MLAFAIMLITFITGAVYADFVPNAHLREFHQALQHGEVVLMVDAPKKWGFEIKEWVRPRHPEAVIGGIGWGLDAPLGIRLGTAIPGVLDACCTWAPVMRASRSFPVGQGEGAP